MKNLFYLLASILLLASCKSAQLELNVMTFNIRLDTSSDSLNAWMYRKDVAARIIKNQDADIVGTQEVLINQLNDLKSRLPEYNSLGVGRADGKEKGEFSAILYKKDRFKVIDSGTFWLSETPEVPGVKGWDAACERIATWGILEDIKSGKQFFAMNTHLDHIGKIARSEGVNLILDRIGKLNKGLSVILTGDFNIRPDNPAIERVIDKSNPNHLVHTKDVAETKSGLQGTFHGYGKIPEERRSFIDYIFVGESTKVLSHNVIPEELDGVYISDHAPVAAKIRLK
jgi:endonuclease/exonuclease/phosphatase family metal-dependent hydrolase